MSVADFDRGNLGARTVVMQASHGPGWPEGTRENALQH